MKQFVYRFIKKVYSLGSKTLIIILPVFALLNLLFSWFNTYVLEAPLFIDSVFTAIAAVSFGPLAGVAVAVLTNFGMELMYGMTGYYWPFVVCSISTALILGFMNRKGYFKMQIHLAIAVIAVAAANALAGAMIAYLLFSGDSGVGIDVIVSAFTETGLSVLASAFLARVPANLIDKMIAVYAAYGVKLLLERVLDEKNDQLF